MPTGLKKIEKDVRKISQGGNIPALEVTIETTEEALTFSYNNENTDPQSIYGIGSTTKLLAAVLAIKKVENGELNLDDPITAYIDPLEMKKILPILVILFATNCRTDKSKQMDDNYKRIIESYIRSYNTFDVEGMIRDLHEAVVFENISNGRVELTTTGIEEFRKQAESAKDYFSERQQSIQSWNFEGNVVTIAIDYQAILAIDLPNGMKPGDTLQLKGQSVFEFKDRKIVKIQDKS